MKRSIVIAGHKTSVTLEGAFWNGLRDIAAVKQMKVSILVESIDKERQHPNLSSALRLFILNYYQEMCREIEAAPALSRDEIGVKSRRSSRER
jgi:predicted DNA-binding ribbon-helix-helix protein